MMHYCINMDGLEEIEAALGKAKDKSKYVLRAAINDSAKEVANRMMKGAGSRYARDKRGMSPYKEVTKIQKATIGKLAAIVEAKDRASDLYDYKLSDRTLYPGGKGAPKLGIKARQLRSGRMTRLMAKPGGGGGDHYRAFVVKYHNANGSDHLAVAERVPGKPAKNNPHKEALRSLYATSKPKAEEVVFKHNVDPEMYDLLMRNIQSELVRFL